MATITSADAIVALSISDVFPVPQIIEKFSVDSSFMSEAIKFSENRLGVDGEMAKGKIYSILPITLSLMPDSPSIDIFNMWANYLIKHDAVDATLVITLLSTGYVYTLEQGSLVEAKLIPDGKKVLEAQDYKIEFPSKYLTVVGI
jgi:hypothetical protein